MLIGVFVVFTLNYFIILTVRASLHKKSRGWPLSRPSCFPAPGFTRGWRFIQHPSPIIEQNAEAFDLFIGRRELRGKSLLR
jgi:hypothetical protein